MNGNPYYDRRYGGPLSATKGFVDTYEQYMRDARISLYQQSLMDVHKARMDYWQKQAGTPDTKITFQVPGPYQYGKFLKQSGITPTGITEQIADIPPDYTVEQAAEFDVSEDMAASIIEKNFPKPPWHQGWFKKDYPIKVVKEHFKKYLQDRGYYDVDKSPGLKRAILEAWESALKNLELRGVDTGEIEFDRDNPEIQALLGTTAETPMFAPQTKTKQQGRGTAPELYGPPEEKSFWTREKPFEGFGTTPSKSKRMFNKLTPEIAAEYLRRANGDRELAKQLATADGYVE